MKESFHENLSALMDGELTQFELRRLLEQGMDDPALEKWRRWHKTRAILQGELRAGPNSKTPNGFYHEAPSIALRSRITEALAQEPACKEQATQSGSRRWYGLWRPLGNIAVAASVSALVVLGWQSWRPSSPLPSSPVALSPTAAMPIFSSRANSPVMPVSENPVLGSAPSLRVSPSVQEVLRLTDQQQDERLRLYFISHSGNAALNTANGPYSYARSVSLQPASAK